MDTLAPSEMHQVGTTGSDDTLLAARPSKQMSDGARSARVAMLSANPSLRVQPDAYGRGAGVEITSFDERYVLTRRMQENSFDIVVLDTSSLDVPAHEFVRDLRRDSDVGIIVASDLLDTVHRVLALEFGADDIIALPADDREVHARIRALARRVQRPVGHLSPGYQFESWRLNLLSRRLVSAQGAEVRLTAKEFEVLSLLLQQSNRPVAREDIHGAYSDRADSRAADALVGRLKRKIIAAGGRDDLIRSVRSVGYVLTANVTQLDSR